MRDTVHKPLRSGGRAFVATDLRGRIRELRESLDLKQHQFGELIGTDQSNVSRWEQGKSRPSDDQIARMAELAGVHPLEFIHGRPGPAATSRAEVPVVGHVGAGAAVFPIDDHPPGQGLEQVPAPEGVDRRPVVAVRVRGESMLPFMKDGWLIFFRRDQDGVPEDCVNQLCVVKLADDGPTLIKELRRGFTPGSYSLFSWNAAPMEDVRLEWAAKVLSIRPK